jgi:phage tail-like protein
MNVNGARFKLLLGREDWARCLEHDAEDALPLDARWQPHLGSPTGAPRHLPAWDSVRHELTLQPLPTELAATAGEARLALEARRTAAADRHGNVYRISDDSRSLRVNSSGSENDSVFWPAGPSDCTQERSRERPAFEPHGVVEAPPAERFLSLAVTVDDYLVVAFARGSLRGLMSFDLIAGGPPFETSWPATVEIEPFDMCTRHGGGVWVLDRVHRRLWELDCSLAVVTVGQPTETLADAQVDDFQPADATSATPARAQPERRFPTGLDLTAAPFSVTDPVAIEPLGAANVLLLDRDDANERSRVIRLGREHSSWRATPSHWLAQLPAPPHDMVYAAAPRLHQSSGTRLFIASAIGNQVHAFEVIDRANEFALQSPAELFPLRLFGGRALIAVRGHALYDSGPQPRWTRVVLQPRRRYLSHAQFVTAVLDSAELGTAWDRVTLDACIPPDTEVAIESRCGDDRNHFGEGDSPPGQVQVIAGWLPEPAPYLRSTGPELPWLREEITLPTRREAGTGTWELLLQRAQGRYLQLRIRLISRNGTSSPRLRALRVWFPRFSYTERFLPTVYREDETQGSFLERWLANFESTLTGIEDRVVAVQRLFDARTVPGDSLPWLAEWFDLALDPAWDERRHRLLVHHAMDFFRWRGTVHGLRLALELAFDRCFDARAFDGPRETDGDAGRIRIVEAYQARMVETLALSAAARATAPADGPRAVERQARWTPTEDNAGLVERYARSEQREADPVEQATAFSLVPPADAATAARWRDFCFATLGFVPAVGAAERRRWQAYLLGRYVRRDELNRQHRSAHESFAAVPLPADAPESATQAADWEAFCARRDGLRERRLWADFLARRYRRIERLQRTHRVHWARFELVPLPDRLPARTEAQTDWLQFERELLAMHRTAHRFSVLLPVASVVADPHELEDRLRLARRIVDLEKPAHTVFDARFYWAFNRIGEARLGLDTQLGAGSRAPELIPDAVVGRAYLGGSFVGGAPRRRGRDRLSLDC